MSIVRSVVVAVVFASAAACSSAAPAPEEATETVSAAKRADPCMTVRCSAGYHCESKGKHASCVADPTCTPAQCGPAPAAPNVLCSDGVHYSGPGPCVRGSDGTCGWTWLTCPASCPIIDCAAPPPGCHYEGMVFSPCDQQTCGSLVCDGSNL